MGIYDLLDEVHQMGSYPPEWWDKMIHKIPETAVKDRARFILGAAMGKVVLDIGCTGALSEQLEQVAAEYHGIDVVPNPSRIQNYHQYDLDRAAHLPPISNLQLIVAGEVIEHLSNAGHFLDLIAEYNCPVILTTPNSNSTGGTKFLQKGMECVNREHVCWYSYHTLKVLVERHGFRIVNWYWYNGQPITAEGLIFKMEPENYGTS
jgi:2-polyprenyl-3-methyl-5-hydroxy-6-metoxy-1,4-benzoquinol methylase